jgi:hypothetical protein
LTLRTFGGSLPRMRASPLAFLRSCRPALVAIVALAILAMAADAPTGFEKYRRAPGPHAKFTKLVVLGIAGDRELRHRFEDRFVSHLRGKDRAARTSYSLVDDLTRPADREKLLSALKADGVDGVLTVRAVPLQGEADKSWPAAWDAWVEAPTTVRALVAASQAEPKGAKRYGVEVTLWELESGARPWAARTGVYERKKLREAAGDLMQETIALLREEKLL